MKKILYVDRAYCLVRDMKNATPEERCRGLGYATYAGVRNNLRGKYNADIGCVLNAKILQVLRRGKYDILITHLPLVSLKHLQPFLLPVTVEGLYRDALNLLRQIRSENPLLRIIIYTGSGDIDHLKNILGEFNINDFVAKTEDPDLDFRKIEACLNAPDKSGAKPLQESSIGGGSAESGICLVTFNDYKERSNGSEECVSGTIICPSCNFEMDGETYVKFIKLACRFESRILVKKDAMTADGKSILDMMTLIIRRGSKITIHAIGSDAHQAIRELVELIKSFKKY